MLLRTINRETYRRNVYEYRKRWDKWDKERKKKKKGRRKMEASTWHVRLIDYIHRGIITKYISAVHDTWLVSIKMEKESGADLNKNPRSLRKMYTGCTRSWEGPLKRGRFQKRNVQKFRSRLIYRGWKWSETALFLLRLFLSPLASSNER